MKTKLQAQCASGNQCGASVCFHHGNHSTVPPNKNKEFIKVAIQKKKNKNKKEKKGAS